MANDIVQTIAEARIDARSLSEFVFKPANFIVSRRLAPSINTLQYYIDKANSVNDAFSKSVSDATAAADIAIIAANTANQNAIGLIDSVTSQASQSVQNAIRDVAIDANLVTDALTTIVPIADSASVRTQLDKNRESVSVYDFFTKAEMQAFRLDGDAGTFDASRPLQAFFDYIHNNDVGVAHCSGYFHTSKGIVWGGNGVRSKTKAITGEFILRAFYPDPIDVLMKIQCGRYCKWIGGITVRGRGSSNYSLRNVNVGLQIGDRAVSENGAAHFNIGSIDAEGGFKDIGIFVENWSTNANLGSSKAGVCGSGYGVGEYTLTTNCTVLNTNNTGGLSQSSTLTVDVMPFSETRTPIVIRFISSNATDDNKLYYVESTDAVSNTIKISPALPADLTSGTIAYYHGAGVFVTGNDTSNVRFGKVSGTGNGVVLWLAAQYQAIVDSFVADTNGVSLILGKSPTGSSLGGIVNSFYSEASLFDLVRLTSSSFFSFTIPSSAIIDFDKLVAIPRTRSNIDDKIIEADKSMKGLVIKSAGQDYSWQQVGASTASTVNIELDTAGTMFYNAWRDNTTVNIIAPIVSRIAAFGYYTKELVVTSASANSVPKGAITIKPPAGYTVNNLASNLVLRGFVRPPRILMTCNVETKNIVVTTSDSPNEAFKVVTFATIANGAQVKETITVLGAALGQPAVAFLNKPLLGARLWAEVVAADTVSVYYRNDTGAELPAISGSLRVQITPSSFVV